MIKLYDHQADQVKRLDKLEKQGLNRILFQAPTGYGKGVVINYLMDRCKKRSMVILPNITLLNKTVEIIGKENCYIMQGAKTSKNVDAQYVVTTRQTFVSKARRDHHIDLVNSMDMIIIDEVHLGGNNPSEGSKSVLMKMLDDYDKLLIGFSATPIKANGTKMEGWDKVLSGHTTEKLIAMEYLSPFKYFSLTPSEIENKVKLARVSSTGDFTQKDMRDISEMEVGIETLVKLVEEKELYLEPTLIFTANIEHAEKLKSTLREELGIDEDQIRIIHSKMKDFDELSKENAETVKQFESGEFNILINVTILTAGFDYPALKNIVISRPIGSASLALQIFGRGLRIDPHNKDKECCIYDLAGVMGRLKLLPDTDIDWEREYKPDGKEFPLFQCKNKECGHVCQWGYVRMKKAKYSKGFKTRDNLCPNCDTVHVKRYDLSEVEETHQMYFGVTQSKKMEKQVKKHDKKQAKKQALMKKQFAEEREQLALERKAEKAKIIESIKRVEAGKKALSKTSDIVMASMDDIEKNKDVVVDWITEALTLIREDKAVTNGGDPISEGWINTIFNKKFAKSVGFFKGREFLVSWAEGFTSTQTTWNEINNIESEVENGY